MPRINRRHEVPYRAQDMYDLVCDVENYPEFVPLCRSLNVKDKRTKGSKSLIVADMTMAYGALSETFTTQVLMNEQDLEIDTRYIDGPFSHLDNQWKFKPLEDTTCCIEFMVDYQLKNRLLSVAAGAIFETAFGRFVEAFEKRAQQLYG